MTAGERFRPASHMTDYFSRQAVKVIETNRNRPFFLYLAYNAPHTPLQSKKECYNALRTFQIILTLRTRVCCEDWIAVSVRYSIPLKGMR